MTARKIEDTGNYEAVDHTLWKAGYGRGYEPVVKHTAR
jgi:hypothetical protein